MSATDFDINVYQNSQIS